jgi:hypothetical protein
MVQAAYTHDIYGLRDLPSIITMGRILFFSGIRGLFDDLTESFPILGHRGRGQE